MKDLRLKPRVLGWSSLGGPSQGEGDVTRFAGSVRVRVVPIIENLDTPILHCCRQAAECVYEFLRYLG